VIFSTFKTWALTLTEQTKITNNYRFLIGIAIHLKNEKIPPCAANNGMYFPEKPDFLFYLNELECRLLAPRLALQNLLQTPSGNRFKMTEEKMWVMSQQMLTILSTCYHGCRRKVEQSKFNLKGDYDLTVLHRL